jgi:hypothetical protein
VQGFAGEDAVRFVSLVRPILRELGPEQCSAALDGRIDRLAAMAADKYAQCREQLARIGAHEVQRANHTQQRIRAKRSA